MKNKEQIEKRKQKYLEQLPNAARGMPAHVLRKQLIELNWVLE